jgi:uncharacterized membrane protein
MSGDRKKPNPEPPPQAAPKSRPVNQLFSNFQAEEPDAASFPVPQASAVEDGVEYEAKIETQSQVAPVQPESYVADITSPIQSAGEIKSKAVLSEKKYQADDINDALQAPLTDAQSDLTTAQVGKKQSTKAADVKLRYSPPWHWTRWVDMILVLAGGLLLLILALAPEIFPFLTPLRWFVGVIFALFAPGYCLTLALFSHANDLDSLERVGLSLGLSVALVPVLALILNWLPVGLTLQGILFAELLFCTIFLIIASWQRIRLAPSKAYTPQLRHSPRRWWSGRKRTDRIAYAIAIPVLVMTSLVTVWLLRSASAEQHLTEFYILGETGLADDYPRQVESGKIQTITVGIDNQEKDEISYWVEARQGTQLVGIGGPYALKPGEEITAPIDIILTESGEDVEVVFLLHRDSEEAPYRSLELWLEVLKE